MDQGLQNKWLSGQREEMILPQQPLLLHTAFVHPDFSGMTLTGGKIKNPNIISVPIIPRMEESPIHMTKQVPIKEIYHYVYYDCRFNLPLFQLVYNNSVIVSHHWASGSLKMIDEVRNNKLREILYNFPPVIQSG